MSFKRKDIEIMAPVGSYESLRAAIDAGADSVYFGVGQLNMRSRSAANFTLDDLARIVSIARRHNVKTYLAVNTLLSRRGSACPCGKRWIGPGPRECPPLIVSDQAGIPLARSIGLEVHISTQLNLSNLESVAFYAQFADVMVLARELTIPQVRAIYDGIRERNICGPGGEPVRIEMFAHGALCMAISGKCYLSLHDTGCSANRGACRQLCRRSYEVRDRDSGTELVIDNHYIMSPKDLCTIDFLDKFLGAGVRVLKIEGRARSAEYVKRVVESYDEALCMIEAGSYTPERARALKERLATVFNRGFWGGYYMGARIDEWSAVYGSAATKRKCMWVKSPTISNVSAWLKSRSRPRRSVSATRPSWWVRPPGCWNFRPGRFVSMNKMCSKRRRVFFVRLKYLRRSTGAINCISSWMRKGTDKRDKTTGKSNEYRKLIA